MPPFQEESSLREAIRTTLLQLCKVGVSYQSELHIEGTIGVTVDRHQVILVHFKECVENPRNGEMQTIHQTPATNQLPEPIRSNLPSSVAMPIQGNIIHHNQNVLMSSPARIARQLLRDPMMGMNISPRMSIGRNVRFDNVQNLQIPNQLQMTPSSLLPADPTFPDSLLSESMLEGRLPSADLGADGPKPGNHTISIDLDSEDSMDEEETFEFINKVGELKTMKKEKVIKKIKRKSEKDAKSVIVIDDQGSEGGFDSAANMQPPHLPPPGITSTLSVASLTGSPNSAPMHMDDFPAVDLLTSPTDTSPTFSAPVSMATAPDFADIKMSIANMGNSAIKGDISAAMMEQSTVITSAQADPSAVIGHIVKTSTVDTNNASPRSSSRSKSLVNLFCEACGKPQKSTGMLEIHLVDFHGITQSNAVGSISHVSCDKCNKKFKHQATLDKHRISHDTNKPHKCKQCDRRYRHKESLSIHTLVHDGKLECQLCQKLYTSRVHFEKHISYMHETRRTSKGPKTKNN